MKRGVTHGIHDAEARERRGHFGDVERVRLVPIEIPKRALELLQLRRRQVRHVARDNLPENTLSDVSDMRMGH